jgi:CubicO group peptidase (beta-lactamase class C family)
MIAPAKVGLCPQRLERTAAYHERLVAERVLPGAVVVAARRGHIAYLRCHGWQDVEQNIAMDENSLFRIYSMTKPVVSVATLLLYEEGALWLQDPVRRYLPELASLKVSVAGPGRQPQLEEPRRDITIHDLLTHTGGLSNTLDRQFGNTGLDSAAFIKAVCQEPLLGHPGEQWRYSVSYDVLGRVIEVISGQSLDVFLAERVFRPLGMVDTAFFVPPSKKHRFTALYEHDAQARIVRSKVEDYPYLGRPVYLSGGGGLVSSTSDYLRFCLMLLNGGVFRNQRLLSPKTVELMRQDHLPPGHPPIEPHKFGYGYGVSVLRRLAEKQGIGSVGEYGWGGYAGTNAWIDPQEEKIGRAHV